MEKVMPFPAKTHTVMLSQMFKAHNNFGIYKFCGYIATVSFSAS